MSGSVGRGWERMARRGPPRGGKGSGARARVRGVPRGGARLHDIGCMREVANVGDGEAEQEQSEAAEAEGDRADEHVRLERDLASHVGRREQLPLVLVCGAPCPSALQEEPAHEEREGEELRGGREDLQQRHRDERPVGVDLERQQIVEEGEVLRVDGIGAARAVPADQGEGGRAWPAPGRGRGRRRRVAEAHGDGREVH